MFMSFSAHIYSLEASLSVCFIESCDFAFLLFSGYQEKSYQEKKKKVIMKGEKQWYIQHCLRWTHHANL